MKRNIFFLSLIGLPCAAMMTPGKRLKSPSEVIKEIAQFRDSLPKDGYLERLNKPVQYADGMRRAEGLVTDALFAHYLCSVYKSSDLSDFKRFILEYQSWERDPIRFEQFQSSSSTNKQSEYHEHLKEEEKRIIKDCQNCTSLMNILQKDIEGLQQLVMYRKPHIETE